MSVNDTPRYQYKLNENFTKGNGACLECIHLSTKEWSKPEMNKIKILEKYVRTKENPKGILDFQRVVTGTNKVVTDSLSSFESVPDKLYTKDEFSLMERPEIVAIAEKYNIDTSHTTTPKLKKKIMLAQKEYEKQKFENDILISGEDESVQ